MTPQEREELRLAVERDVNQVLAACLPTYINWVSNTIEPKEVTGCIHPIDSAVLLPGTVDKQPSIICTLCQTRLDKELIEFRVNRKE